MKNKIKNISIIFLTSISFFIIAANITHKYLPEKWIIDYRFSVNEIYRDNLKQIDKILLDLQARSINVDVGFDTIISDTINNAPSKIMNLDIDLLKDLNEIKLKSNYIKFSTQSLDGLDKKVDLILDEVNKHVKEALITRFNYFEERIIFNEFEKKMNQNDKLKKKIENMDAVKSGLIFKDENNKKFFLKKMLFSELERQLDIEGPFDRESLKLYIIDQDSDVDSGNLDWDDLLVALKEISENKILSIDSFREYYKKSSYKLKRLYQYQNEILNRDYMVSKIRTDKLYYVESEGIYVGGNFKSSKPSKFYMNISFLFIGIVFAIFYTFLYLNLAILKNMTKKRLTTLLDLK